MKLPKVLLIPFLYILIINLMISFLTMQSEIMRPLLVINIDHPVEMEMSDFILSIVKIFYSANFLASVLTFIIYLIFISTKKLFINSPIKRCKICNEKFTWLEVIRSNYPIDSPIKCKKCETKYKIKNRFILSFITYIPVVIVFNVFNFFDKIMNLGFMVGLLTICFAMDLYMLLAMIILPFCTTYKITYLDY